MNAHMEYKTFSFIISLYSVSQGSVETLFR